MNELEQRVKVLEGIIFNLIKSDRMFLQQDLQMNDGRDIQVGRSNGTRIATAADQKLGFWGTTPVIQQTTVGSTGNMTSTGGAAVLEANGFKGYTNSGTSYTIGDVVGALKAYGFLPI